MLILNLRKISKAHSNLDFIVLRKNYKIIETLGVIYNNPGLVEYKKIKIIVLDIPRLSFWLYVHNLLVPKWIMVFIRNLINVSYTRNLSFALSSINCVQEGLVPRTSLCDYTNVTRDKRSRRLFYKYNAIYRHWYRHINDKLVKRKLNVHLYRKKV